MQLIPRVLLAAAAAAALLAAGSGTASAYPQFQFSTGAARCSLCHYAPAGGGLINKFGRNQAGATISQFGGSGDLLHGLYDEPDVFQLGGDYRGALMVRHQTDDPEVLFFPMQTDIYTRLAFGSISVNTTLGVRRIARDVEQPSFLTRFESREHYVMWRPRTRGYYARGGRFFAPYGLRSQNHTDYVRRYLGFHSSEETYGASVGRVENQYEWHATAHTAVPEMILGNGPRGHGVTGTYERRLGKGRTTAVGGQARVRIDPGIDQHYLAGGTFKHYFAGAKVLVMAELDLGVQAFTRADRATANPPTRLQLASYLGATYFPFKGFMASAIVENFEQDLMIRGTQRDALSLVLQYFPYAHFEFMLIGKLELVGGEPINYVMFQYHYYL
jgi:hypothetical protein